jgi:hypothetical protein
MPAGIVTLVADPLHAALEKNVKPAEGAALKATCVAALTQVT